MILNVHDKYILHYLYNNLLLYKYMFPDFLNIWHYYIHIEQKGSAEKILDNHNKTAYCHTQDMESSGNVLLELYN